MVWLQKMIVAQLFHAASDLTRDTRNQNACDHAPNSKTEFATPSLPFFLDRYSL
jgi:hypothetical protein